MQNPKFNSDPPYTVALVHGGPGADGEIAPLARELAGGFGLLEPPQTTNLPVQIAELASQLRSRAELHAA